MISLSQAIDLFTASTDFYSGRIDRKAVGEMVHFLRENPEAIPELLGRLKDGQLDQELHAFVFFTLTKVGTPGAQRALIEVMNDVDHTDENRMQAMHAVADVEKLLPEAVEALIDIAQTFGDAMEDENSLESTALLALGVVERRQLHGESEELAKRASDFLLQKMKGEAGEQEKAVLVEALGNTGNVAHAQIIIDQFADESPIVRTSAARALSRMGSPDADQALLEAVGRESAADTRQEIAHAWATKFGPQGTFDTKKLIAMTGREPEANIRASLITVLGREAESRPEAKAALVAQYAMETSPQMKYKIGMYLRADELPR